MVTHTKHLKHAKKEHKVKQSNSNLCIGCVLELPHELTKVGLTGDGKAIAILLIVENIKPQDKRYKSVEAEESMRLMRQVLINRLKNKPSRYNAPGAKTTTDIIRGKGQFRGFNYYPKTDYKDVYDAFDAVIKSNVPSVKKYVDMAIKIAALDEDSIKPSIPNVAGWMTAGSEPGGDFKSIKTVAGNTFFIDDPRPHPAKAKSSKKQKLTSHIDKHSSSKKQSIHKPARKHKK